MEDTKSYWNKNEKLKRFRINMSEGRMSRQEEERKKQNKI